MSHPPRVWKQLPSDYPKQVELTVSVAAPLLAGFSLTATTQLITGKDQPWLGGYAIAMFAIAAVLLLFAVLFSSTALSHAATPSEHLDYNPEARFNPAILQKVRKRQWKETARRYQLGNQGRACFHLGIFAFLSGFGLILVPQHNWPWPPGQFVGVVVVGVALIIQGSWTYDHGKLLKRLFPAPSQKKPDSIPDEWTGYLFGTHSTAPLTPQHKDRWPIEDHPDMPPSRPPG